MEKNRQEIEKDIQELERRRRIGTLPGSSEEEAITLKIEELKKSLHLHKIEGYKYHIFLSYKRSSIFKAWVIEMFLPHFKDCFEQLYGKVEIYKGREETFSNDSVSSEVKDALVHSCCLVALCSPGYFMDAQCLYEISVILQRECRIVSRVPKTPNYLIIPVQAHGDDEDFPTVIRKREHIFDCRNYTRLGLKMDKSGRYIQFQDKMLSWIRTVADAIKKAPLWNNEMLDDLVPEQAIIDSIRISSNISNLPTLSGK